MAGLCDVKFPPDFEPEPEHFVACWLYQDGPVGGDNNAQPSMKDNGLNAS
jgi:hypothetical protein